LKTLDVQVKPIVPADDKRGTPESCSSTSVLVCGIGQHVFDVRMPREKAVLIKMADFGTADVNSDTLDTAVGVDHFTTLENTPPELLFYGSKATQTYALDTFALGLATLHLFTGEVCA
jgi:hypothetical protein